ncbi:DUF2905 domain-containing protein [Marinicrinis lubricantis]|uniref:DUF2905 domain-containing protein n=1 Tax=Marinicrinis lubricantis TaxID=2086470 RepID=A0ABW1IL95_9BACL
MNPAAKWMIIGGIVLVILGVLWQLGLKNVPLGRLPGDIRIEKENVRFYFPITTSIMISIIVSLLYYLVQIFKK